MLQYMDNMVAVFIDRNFNVIDHFKLGTGPGSAINLNKQLLVTLACQSKCRYLVLAQNNFNLRLKPTEKEKKQTDELKALFEMLGIDILDRIIINNEAFYSYLDAGILL